MIIYSGGVRQSGAVGGGRSVPTWRVGA